MALRWHTKDARTPEIENVFFVSTGVFVVALTEAIDKHGVTGS